MSSEHNKNEILALLKKSSTGTLGTLEKESQNVWLRVMYYGVDDNFNCYFMSTRESPKISQIMSSSLISFLVSELEEPYDRSWEIEINGNAQVLSEKQDLNFALGTLKDRNPFSDVAIESGITSYFVLVKLIPQIIKFRLYGEALQGEPPTIIQF